MAGRTRITNVTKHKGSFYNFLAGIEKDSERIISHDRISDSSGYTFHEPLEIVHFKASGGIINGKTLSTDFSNYPSDWLNLPYSDIVADPFAPPEEYLYSKLLSKSNPSNPEVSLPNFLLELRDIPRMLRDAGELIITSKAFQRAAARVRSSLSREAANRWLSIRFGYVPLISDVNSMLSQTNSISKRLNRITNLANNRRETVRRNLAHTRGIIPGLAFMQTQGGLFLAPNVSSHNHKYSGYVTWVLTDPSVIPPLLSDRETLASQIVYKRTIDLEVIWDAVPWTWLIDYFSNLGDIVSLTNNQLKVEPTNVRLMRSSVVTVSTGDSFDGEAKCSAANASWTTKSRWIPAGNIKPTFWLGALTNAQLGTLAALGKSRLR